MYERIEENKSKSYIYAKKPPVFYLNFLLYFNSLKRYIQTLNWGNRFSYLLFWRLFNQKVSKNSIKQKFLNLSSETDTVNYFYFQHLLQILPWLFKLQFYSCSILKPSFLMLHIYVFNAKTSILLLHILAEKKPVLVFSFRQLKRIKYGHPMCDCISYSWTADY